MPIPIPNHCNQLYKTCRYKPALSGQKYLEITMTMMSIIIMYNILTKFIKNASRGSRRGLGLQVIIFPLISLVYFSLEQW